MYIYLPKLAILQKIKLASLLIRIGLAVVFVYAAVSALQHPNAWIGFVPNFVSHFTSLKFALDTISYFQIIVAIWLLSGKYAVLAGLVSIGLVGGIVIFNTGALLITFRDFGILFASAALIILELPSKK